ncbi:hypothetical protein SAMN04487969_101139 [Paenibacillus algorifonticola]|uniref:Uncharacterized protein n=1 Tax=Paenibacillus algorifonticola TaxID=684063 RepID=A0A1I1XWU4_9BACL|nr:hypothetical protein [Paenibacillus algorifonticola]SFE11659.1 hypothetical protein SAMN04487969_101139 [Paenibacillus algorifonticola]
MAMADYKVRVMANACISRYDKGERGIADIVASYGLPAADAELVMAEITAKRSDLQTS